MTPRDTLFTGTDPDDDPERDLLTPQRAIVDRIFGSHAEAFDAVYVDLIWCVGADSLAHPGNDTLNRLADFFERVPR